jgi:heme/copper-type cytochrome/quinol oxidase subunit 1
MGAVFGLFSGFFYWIYKIVGATYNEELGQLVFWLMFIGVNITFFPMHFMGISGMPRRIPDFPDHFAGWNTISSFGSTISVCSVVLFIYISYNIKGKKK